MVVVFMYAICINMFVLHPTQYLGKQNEWWYMDFWTNVWRIVRRGQQAKRMSVKTQYIRTMYVHIYPGIQHEKYIHAFIKRIYQSNVMYDSYILYMACDYILYVCVKLNMRNVNSNPKLSTYTKVRIHYTYFFKCTIWGICMQRGMCACVNNMKRT